MNTGEIFPYRLSIRDSVGYIRGYAYTYASPDETKATITGTIDKQQHTITFKETGIVTSHDVRTKAFMCLINASLEYVRDKEGRKLLKGSVTGEETDNTACTGGILTFSNEDEIKELFSDHTRSDTVIEMGSHAKKVVAAKTETTPIAEAPVLEKVTAGLEKVYEWHTDSVVLEIWDGGTIDEDMVSIGYNSVEYLRKYELMKQKKRLVFPVSKDKTDILVLLAENEGTDPPNTANVRLCDGEKCYNLLSYNKKGQKSLIKIKWVQ